MTKIRAIVVALLMGIALCGTLCAQSLTRIRGKVTDAATGEPIPFASIFFPGMTIGTSTDLEGIYSLETREDVKELIAEHLSYESQTEVVTMGAFNAIDFSLHPTANEIDAILILPGENPAHAILDSVSHYKFRNDPARKDSYQYSTYTKMELDMANISSFKSKRMQRNFGFVFDYMDTSAMTGQVYLPVMISESTADYHYRKSPRMARELIKASRISGVDDYNLAQFTGGLYVDVNLYDNYINILEVNVPSPLCEHGRGFYNYFLIDSLDFDGRKTYHIRFHPKSVATPVFDGEFNIDAGDWALHSGKMRLAKSINVNWLRSVYLENHNARIDDSTWFKKQDRIMADFSVTMSDSSRLISFLAQRTIDYSDVQVNKNISPEILDLHANVVFDPSVVQNDESYWAKERPYELSEREQGIYRMVDSVKQVPLFSTFYDLINTLVVGYQKAGPVEFGSLYKLYSFNDLEGSRIQLGMRTNTDFHEKLRFSGYGAYGFKDKQFKGGGGVEYVFKRQPFSKLTVSGKHDLLQLSASSNLFATGNLLSSIFTRGDNEKLVMMDQARIQFEREWSPNISNTLSVEWRELSPSRFVPFTRPDGTMINAVRTAEVTLGTRISHDEIIHRRPYEKYHMYSKYPVLDVELTAGLKNLLGSDCEYYRTLLGIHYWLNTPPVGRSTFDVQLGKIFGTVPFPLLKIHEGNATYFYDKGAFSCMNFYEFASDTWASVMYEHHFRGFFLGRIPLLKRLQWREVITCKALWGTLSEKNNGSRENHSALLDFPTGMSSVSKPYVEAGFGIENIFRVIRLDAAWRITHRNEHSGKKVNNFAFNVSMHFDF